MRMQKKRMKCDEVREKSSDTNITLLRHGWEEGNEFLHRNPTFQKENNTEEHTTHTQTQTESNPPGKPRNLLGYRQRAVTEDHNIGQHISCVLLQLSQI